ncbi:acyl-CoA N-acyltransferase [Mycena albidolilacea]|uniref:Acyl-CoA N-acyltransferase n=1 Tax=Mycena albidolilacea TaxID=1033008 RepID=A0AAD6Z1R4_9AGAR|nr:acyl-CoA N-acyltransferase [Mycena albidolilacea]
MAPPHDVNFCFPVPPNLQNDRVKLVPFFPSEHADAFFAAAGAHPELFTYLTFGAQDFVTTVIEQRIQPDRGTVLFAVFDTSVAGAAPQLAGTIGLLDTSAANLSTEVGFVITLPRFQRTHVTSNAAGLLLQWALETPEAGGLGLRRVAWKANVHNAGSVRVAERLGFRREGVLRWDRVIPAGRTKGGNGGGVRGGDPRPDYLSRDTLLLGLCWDDWESGARESVNKIMQRR